MRRLWDNLKIEYVLNLILNILFFSIFTLMVLSISPNFSYAEFDEKLNEKSMFGKSIINIGDFDGDGITDLAVGASADDDGGLNSGAIYILFINDDGTVK